MNEEGVNEKKEEAMGKRDLNERKKREMRPQLKSAQVPQNCLIKFCSRILSKLSFFLSRRLLFSVSPLSLFYIEEMEVMSSWALGGLPLCCCCCCYLFSFLAVGQLFDSLLLFLPVSYIDGTSCHFPVSWASSIYPTEQYWASPFKDPCSLFYSFSRTILHPSLLPPSTPGNWPWSIRSFSLFSISPPTSPPLAKETHWNCHLGLT